MKKAETFIAPWKKEERKVGRFLGMGLAALAGWGIFKIIPILTSLVFSVVYLAIASVLAGILVIAIMTPMTWTIFSNIYMSFVRKVGGLLVVLDPFGVMENQLTKLRRRREELNDKRHLFDGQIEVMKAGIRARDAERSQLLREGAAARRASQKKQFVLRAYKAGVLGEANRDIAEVLARVEVMQRGLAAMADKVDLLVEVTEIKISTERDKWETMRAAHSMMTDLKSILQGDPTGRELAEMALAHVAQDIAAKSGEVESFMRMSDKVLDGIDLQQGIYNEDAIREIEAWEQGDSLLLGDDKRLLIAGVRGDTREPVEMQQGSESIYRDAIKK